MKRWWRKESEPQIVDWTVFLTAAIGWALILLLSSGCGPTGPIGRLLGWSGDKMAAKLRHEQEVLPDQEAATRIVWNEVLGRADTPPTVDWVRPEQLKESERCTQRYSGKVGYNSAFAGCVGGVTYVPWWVTVVIRDGERISETAFDHEHLHAHWLRGGVPLPHHYYGDTAKACEATPPEKRTGACKRHVEFYLWEAKTTAALEAAGL